MNVILAVLVLVTPLIPVWLAWVDLFRVVLSSPPGFGKVSLLLFAFFPPAFPQNRALLVIPYLCRQHYLVLWASGCSPF